jgi:hypothetical protein
MTRQTARKTGALSVSKNSFDKVGKEMGVSYEYARVMYNKIINKIAKRILIKSEIPATKENCKKLVDSEEFEEILCESCWAQWGSL